MILFLLGLIFFSKFSFHFIPGIPYESSVLIFQHGIHPYINIILCILIGGFLILQRLLRLKQPIAEQLKVYKFLVFLISLYLLMVTCLQIIFNESAASPIMQIGSAIMAILTMYLFGQYLPTQVTPEFFVRFIQKTTQFLCWICLFFLIVSPATSFNGGRYIGAFKHIPHMVSTATIAFVFTLYNIFCLNETRVQRIISYSTIVCSFILLVLTGTRSALASLMVCLVLAVILFKPKDKTDQWGYRWIRLSAAVGCILVTVFFSQDLTNYAIDIFKGEKSIGYRAAQDGVSSRMDEITRGFESFNENPWIGYGLLSKFGQSEDGGVGHYNANKDPHNILISAGIIGGWGFIVVILFSYMGLIILSFKRLIAKDNAVRLLAIYMCSQLPIIFIYHMHLSLGGIADRIYWLVIGFLALKIKNTKSQIIGF